MNSIVVTVMAWIVTILVIVAIIAIVRYISRKNK